MIVIMTKKERDSIMNRQIVEMSDLIIVMNGNGAFIDKNKFGQSREISKLEISHFIDAYITLSG